MCIFVYNCTHKTVSWNSVSRDVHNTRFLYESCTWRDLWRTVTNIRGWRQIGFTPYDLFSWNKYDISTYIINNLITFKYIDKGSLTMLTLCTLGPLCHAWLFFPSSSCSMLPLSLLGFDCLSRSLSGWPGSPSHPSPGLTPFPWADPISLRSQATPYPFAGHNS